MALAYVKDITTLIPEEVIALSILNIHRTFWEEVLHTLRNQFFGSGSAILRNFVNFEGTKYVFLTANNLLLVNIKGIDRYQVASKGVFTLQAITNAKTEKRRNYAKLSFDYQGGTKTLKLLGAAVLPGGKLYYEKEINQQCFDMRDTLIEHLVK